MGKSQQRCNMRVSEREREREEREREEKEESVHMLREIPTRFSSDGIRCHYLNCFLSS